MEPSSQLHPATGLSTPLYYQLTYTLTDLLPPPLDDTQEGLRARNHAAIAKVAALLPVNANELDLAAQCIAARAQAEDILRLLRQHAADIALVLRLNAQYASMVRTSLSVLGRLMRVQALRQKREAIEGAASEDAWALHTTEQSMLKVADPHANPPQAAAMDQKIQQPVSERKPNPQDMAFGRGSANNPGTEAPKHRIRRIYEKSCAQRFRARNHPRTATNTPPGRTNPRCRPKSGPPQSQPHTIVRRLTSGREIGSQTMN